MTIFRFSAVAALVTIAIGAGISWQRDRVRAGYLSRASQIAEECGFPANQVRFAMVDRAVPFGQLALGGQFLDCATGKESVARLCVEHAMLKEHIPYAAPDYVGNCFPVPPVP